MGDCVVARADKKELDTATLAAITDNLSDILDASGRKLDGTAIAQKYYSRAKLDRIIDQHLQMQHANKRHTPLFVHNR